MNSQKLNGETTRNIFSFRFPIYRLVIMLNLPISHVCLSPVNCLELWITPAAVVMGVNRIANLGPYLLLNNELKLNFFND